MTFPHLPRTLFAAVVLATASTMAATDSAGRHDEVSTGAKPCRIDNMPRPCVLLSRDRLEGLKKEISVPGPKRDYFDKHLRTNADRWLGRDITIPARSGHYHNFTCTDGTRLDLPGKDQDMVTSGPYRCPACGRMYEGEKFDGAVRNVRHVWTITGCRDMALMRALTGERKYAEKAAEILRKYADAYPGRHTKNIEGGIFYQSLDESMHFIVLAQAYDLIADAGVLSDADKQHIEQDLFWESAAGLIACGARTNWGSWHLSAVGVIGIATRHQRLIDYGIDRFRAQIRDELGSDGLWPESVHTYHFFPLRGFLLLAEACANAGIDLYQWQAGDGRSLRTMLTAPIGYAYPDMRLAAINDGWFEAFMPLDQYLVAWHRYHLPEFAWVIAERSRAAGAKPAGSAIRDDVWSFVIGEEIPEQTASPDLHSIDFSNIGISVLRTRPDADPRGEMMLTFDYGRHLGHGQLDKMGITLFGNGRLLVADYGTPSYGAAILPYYTGTWSHNTVIVDGQNQKHTKKGERLAFSNTPLLKASCARTDEAYPGVDWRRCVLLVDDSYVLVVDDLASSASRTYDWLLHCEGDRLRTEGLVTATTVTALGCPYFSDVALHAAEGPRARLQWLYADGSGLSMAAALDPGSLVFTARCPAESAVRTVPVAVLRKTGHVARFACVMAVRGHGGSPGADFEARLVDEESILVTGDKVRDTFTITNRGIDLQSEGSQSAQVAVPFED